MREAAGPLRRPTAVAIWPESKWKVSVRVVAAVGGQTAGVGAARGQGDRGIMLPPVQLLVMI